MANKALAAAIRNCGGRLVKGGETVDGDYYEFKARFDDEDQIDEFLDENQNDLANTHYVDVENKMSTLWFNLKKSPLSKPSFIDNGESLLLLKQDEGSSFKGLEISESNGSITLKAKVEIGLDKNEAIQLAGILLNWVNGKGIAK